MMKAFIGILALLAMGDGAKILAIIPILVKSHFILIEPLLRELAARGHHLTVFTSFPKTFPSENYTEIDCAEGRTTFQNSVSFDDIDHLCGTVFSCIDDIIQTTQMDCEFLYNKSKINFIKDKYDLLIAEMFGSNCFLHIANKLNIPSLVVSTNVPMPWTSDKFGLPDNPSYIPNSMSSFTPNMNLWQRIWNTAVLTYGKLIFKLHSKKCQRFAEEYFQERLPWVEDLARNCSLLLINSHFSLTNSRPLPPNAVEVGGMHIKKPRPLPEDLQELLDNATQGVILFTFGSMIRISTFPTEKISMIFNVFSKIPQTVLMKYEENLPDSPKNVVVKKWLPQRDILGHNNLVAFITHGGLASMMEAVYSAKPVVGIPFFSDQFLNVNNLAWRGAGVKIDFASMTEEDFGQAVDQVLHNKKIVENMKRLSEQFRDRPQTALQTAVYWTEYVIRHRGAPHLRPVSPSMPIYQLLLLDVLAVLMAALALVGYALYAAGKLLNNVFNTARKKSIENAVHSEKNK